MLAQVIVAALSTSSGAAPRTRHVTEPPRKVALDDGGARLDIDVPEVALARPRAVAAAAERDAGWHLGVGLGADIPLDALNVGLVIQAPSGLRLSSSVGFLTDVFLGGMDAPDGGPAATAMMHAALRDATVWRTHLGWKPWTTHGFYASGGYSLYSFGVTMTAGDATAALVGEMLPANLGSIPLVHMTSTLHALDVEAGWEWPIARRFKFRTAVSAGMVITSSTHLHVEDGPLAILPLPIDKVIAPIERAGEAVIDAMCKGAGPIVMLTVQLQVDLL
ncbi:MAG TPA: hypothetical protein VGD37_37085 [Kofleriaceae bacterium]